jgi:hypothetical protein
MLFISILQSGGTDAAVPDISVLLWNYKSKVAFPKTEVLGKPHCNIF